jgi:curved DNA-binding protein CbpA
MAAPRTLYELLGVSGDATASEISEAYCKLLAILQSGEHALSPEDAAAKFKAAKQALDVLSDDSARAAYDAKLAAAMPQGRATPAGMPAGEVVYAVERVRPMQVLRPLIAVLKAIILLILIAFLLMVLRNAGRSSAGADALQSAAEKKDEEKAAIQEYYQRNGVRVGSKAEIELLEAANRDAANRQKEQDRKKAEEDRKYQEFLRESRQEGERVSNNLRRAEESAQREEERQRKQAEYEQRMAAAREEARIEAQRRKWQRDLRR